MFSFIFILLMALPGIMDFTSKDKRLIEKIKKHGSPASIEYFEFNNHRIRYVDVGLRDNPLIVFIHGAPGTLEAFNGFLNDASLRANFRMISIDRPGYGHSNFGTPLIDVQKQTLVLGELVKQLNARGKTIIVGHSYGGTYAVRMAMDFPDLMDGIILVGAAVDPDHERIFWISSLEKVPPFTWVVPLSLKVANAEKLSHIDELTKMQPLWDHVKTKVVILHGEKDGLVPVENAYFANRKLGSSHKKLVIKKNVGHLIPWTNPELVTKEIYEMVRN